MYVSRDRERQDRRTVNGKIAGVNAEIGPRERSIVPPYSDASRDASPKPLRFKPLTAPLFDAHG